MKYKRGEVRSHDNTVTSNETAARDKTCRRKTRRTGPKRRNKSARPTKRHSRHLRNVIDDHEEGESRTRRTGPTPTKWSQPAPSKANESRSKQ